MGSQLQLCTTVGSQLIGKMHTVLVASCLAAAAFADAEPGYLGYGLGGVSTGVGLHPTGVVYESRSAQGLGKRSVDAEPGYLRSYGYGLGSYGYGLGSYGYGLGSYGYGIGGISRGVGLHQTGSVYESRSAQGLGERSADAEPGYFGLGGISTGVGLQPSGAVYESRSAQGLSGRYLY